MKLYLRTVCLIIALLLTASAFGCGLEGIGDETSSPLYAEITIGEEYFIEPEQTTESIPEATTEVITELITDVITEATTEAATEPPPTETATEVLYNDPIIQNPPSFRGDKVRILTWKEAKHGEFVFNYEDKGTTALSSALYKRNTALEELLYINLEFVTQSGDPANASVWNKYLTNCVSAAAREYDFIAGSSVAIASNAVTGLLINLLDINSDGTNEPQTEQWLMQPQWFESTSQARIGTALYFATGTYSPNALSSIYACYVNRDLLNFYGFEDPTELVDSHEWTFEKFFEICRGVYSDENSNGLKDYDGASGDIFSHITSKTSTDAWYYATGARYCELDENGAISVSPKYNSDQILTAVSTLTEHFGSGGDGFISDNDDVPIRAFVGDNAFFMTESLGAALDDTLKNSESLNCSIIPLPKYDKAQEKYLSVMNEAYSLFAIPADAPDRERAITVLQCFAAIGYRNIPGAFYSQLFDSEYSDSVQSRCFDIICTNVVYDHGRLFAKELIGQNKEFRNALTDAGDFALLLKQLERVFGRSIEGLMQRFK